MIQSGIPDHTLALTCYWDYESDARLRPLRDGEPHSFLFSEKERVQHLVISFSDCIQH
jgi:hypothetical protein